MLDYNLRAVFAVHLAAPVEFAVAAAHHLRAPLLHPQAAFVAQPAAAPLLPLGQTLSVLHALAPLGAVQPQAAVRPAVVRRVLHVDELCRGDAAESVRDGAAVVRAVASSHALFVDVQLLGLAVLDLQVVANFSEIRQLRPAGLDTAALGHAVASADALHCCLHSLLETRESYIDFSARFKTVKRHTDACAVEITYQAPCLVVVQVDSSPGVLTCLLSIHILFGNPLSEICIVTAATPQPATTTCTQNVT